MTIKLPKIDKILNLKEFQNHIKPMLKKITQNIIDEQRQKALNNENYLNEQEIIEKIKIEYEKNILDLKPVINATGIVVHTNLGRSVIHPEIFERAKEIICSYSNLEYDLQNGKRGQRYDYISKLLCTLFNCESALVVNNNASAVFLVLNTFCKNKEVIVSRGELVEIGGSFRVPEVMASSGAILKEVGTTNKTKISDYEEMISENTSMLLKVHQSNFSIQGFTCQTSLEEINNLAKKNNLIDYYDLGSAYVNALPYALGKDEPPINKVLESGISLVSFSGDKLFGSVQCGIILGKKELIEKLKQNQLLRMLRVDKITISLLAQSIKAYINKEFDLIPTQHQIYKNIEELKKDAFFISSNLKTKTYIKDSFTFVGGGTMPCKNYPSIVLAFEGDAIKLEKDFRNNGVIGRIENDYFVLDFRSILQKDLNNLLEISKRIFNE